MTELQNYRITYGQLMNVSSHSAIQPSSHRDIVKSHHIVHSAPISHYSFTYVLWCFSDLGYMVVFRD